ncbi:MAG: hypothetical protein P4L43_07690 [Syntrophobacteraceae bacterium]|nr:hypothetical protein [Syntrophobacteraceae bacterium]
MKNPKDIDSPVLNPVWHNVWSACYDEFPRIWYATRTTNCRMLRQNINTIEDTLYQFCRRLRIILSNIICFGIQVF